AQEAARKSARARGVHSPAKSLRRPAQLPTAAIFAGVEKGSPGGTIAAPARAHQPGNRVRDEEHWLIHLSGRPGTLVPMSSAKGKPRFLQQPNLFGCVDVVGLYGEGHRTRANLQHFGDGLSAALAVRESCQHEDAVPV